MSADRGSIVNKIGMGTRSLQATPMSPDGATPQPFAGADVERWRHAFIEEANTCIKALRRAFDDADITRAALRFDEWRKVDISVTAQLQQHVEALIKHNQTMQQLHRDFFVPAEFARFQASVTQLQRSVDELKNGPAASPRGQISVTVSEAHAAGRKADSREEASISATAWHRHMEVQRERWARDDERWAALTANLQQMQERLGQLDEVVATRFDLRALGEPEALPQQVARTLASVVRGAVEDICTPMRALADSLRRSVAADCESVRQHTTRSLAAALGDGERIEQPLGPLLERVDAGLRGLEPFRDQAEHWRKESEHWRAKATEASNAQQEARAEARRVCKESSRLHDEMTALQGRANELQLLLDAAQAAPGRDVLKEIAKIESRGNVKFDLRTGHVELLNTIDFAAQKVSEQPVADFKHPDVADLILGDVAQLVAMFGAPVEIEAHTPTAKAGSPSFWEEAANSRARLVRSHLQSRGIPRETMIAQGLPGKRGLNRACVLFRCRDNDIFATGDAVEPEKQQGRTKSRSPRAGSRSR